MSTYGQFVNGKALTYEEFKKEVLVKMKMCMGSQYILPESECKKLYKKGYSIEDACSFLL